MQLQPNDIAYFREAVWDYYRRHARPMPWREQPTPYFVLVSELMLQQTQVNRVLPKFAEFVAAFPDFATLAAADLGAVLAAWNGLGYNRRAKFLHQAAQAVMTQHSGQLPDAVEQLVSLPGIGANTAGAIMAYAFNQPVVFIETNIRTVFFHHFFADHDGVDDKQLASLVEQTLEHETPREWYWALMDYGTHLKQTQGNNIWRSRHYAKQSKFEGSRRQIRGQVIKHLLGGPQDLTGLQRLIPDGRAESVVDDLVREGLIITEAGQLRLTPQPKLP